MYHGPLGYCVYPMRIFIFVQSKAAYMLQYISCVNVHIPLEKDDITQCEYPVFDTSNINITCKKGFIHIHFSAIRVQSNPIWPICYYK